MDLKDFEKAVLRHGGAIENWPAPLCTHALAFLREEPNAAALLREIAMVEQTVVDLGPEPEPPATTARRVVAAVLKRDAAPIRRPGWREAALAAGGISLSGLAGFLLGDFIFHSKSFAAKFGILPPLDLFLLIT